MYKYVIYAHRHFFSFDRGSFIVLSALGHAESPPEHHGATVGPGRDPWHVLWGFKVASNHGEAFRARRGIQAHANPRTGKKKKNVPTIHVISRTFNVVKNCLVMEICFPDTNVRGMRPLLVQ